ncbi:hypothetical protein E3P94_04103 [Wallemia ichthyophaga]|nr:hypothetical protein E3P95_04098 [Wallemia ichthyophaga]TIA95293.1 hypothetical protein E3P94_04103 [Wallemia ichthyophaga]
MGFPLFKKKSKSQLKKPGSAEKKKEISRPLQLPFPSSVSLHDIRDSLIHPLPDLHTRRRSKSTSSSAGNPDKQFKESPELFTKEADPFAPPVPKIPAIYHGGEASMMSSSSNRDDSTHIEFQYRDSQSSRLGRPSGDINSFSKTEPPKRPPRTRRPIPFIGMSNFLKKRLESYENERASPPPRTAKVSFTQSIKGLGMRNKSLRHSVSDESFESVSIYSTMRTPPMQSGPPPRPSRLPPNPPILGRGRSSTVSGAPPLQESQIIEARLNNALNTATTRKRSNSSPSVRKADSGASNKYSSLHSIPFSLQAIKIGSSSSSIPNERSSSGISVNVRSTPGTPDTRSFGSSPSKEHATHNAADQTGDTKNDSISHENNQMVNSSTLSSFNDGNNSFDPSQFLNSYTKDDSLTSFELDKSVLSPSSSKKELDKSSLMALGPSPNSKKFGFFEGKRFESPREDEEVISNGSNDVLNVSEYVEGHCTIGSEFFKSDQDAKDRSKIFSSLEAVKKHMSTDSFNDDSKSTEDGFSDTFSNFSSPPPLLDLRPLSPLKVSEYEGDESSEDALDYSPTRSPSQQISGLVLTSSPSRDSLSTVTPSQSLDVTNDDSEKVDKVDNENLEQAENVKMDKVESDDIEKPESQDITKMANQDMHKLEKDLETEKTLRDSVSIYDDDEVKALQKKIADMAKVCIGWKAKHSPSHDLQKLEDMRQSGGSASMLSSKSKDSLPPSFSFQLDPRDRPELNDGVELLDTDKTPPQEIALPAVGPDEIELPESPLDSITCERSQKPASAAPTVPETVQTQTGNHIKNCSVNGSIDDRTTRSTFHVTNASNSSRSSQEEEDMVEDNKVIHISPESQKKLQTQLRRISEQPVAADPPKPKATEASPKANQKPANATAKPQAQKRAEISSLSLRDWMPTPLSPKIAEETEPSDEQPNNRRRRRLREADMNIDHSEPKMIHPPRFSSFKATPNVLSQAQVLEKKNNDKNTRNTWLKPSNSISTVPRSTPSPYKDENRSRRISQQPIDNSVLPQRNASKAAKSNTSWLHTMENEFDSIHADPSGEKRRSDLEQQQIRARMAMDAAWKAARSSSVPPVEEYAPRKQSKERISLLLPQKKELEKKALPTLPYSAPAQKTSFASGLEGVRNRDSQHVPSLPSMKSFRASIEAPQHNSRTTQYDRRINAAVESSLGSFNSKSMNTIKSVPPSAASNSTRKARPTRLDELGPNKQSSSFGYFNNNSLQTPPLTATSSASSVAGFDSIMTPRSYSHKREASASSMDSMSARSVSSEGSAKPASNRVSYLPQSKSGYSLKGESGYGYAI